MGKYRKSDIVDKLSGKLDMTKRETDRFIDELFNEITEIMKNEDSVVIAGFGRFEGVRRDALQRKCLKGEGIMDIPERVAPVFRPSLELKKHVNM